MELKDIPADADWYCENGERIVVLVGHGTHDCMYTGTFYELDGYEELVEIGEIYLKFDGCCHIGFRSPDMQSRWVHVCGPERMETMLRVLRWVWVTAQSKIPHYDQDEHLSSGQ